MIYPQISHLEQWDELRVWLKHNSHVGEIHFTSVHFYFLIRYETGEIFWENKHHTCVSTVIIIIIIKTI